MSPWADWLLDLAESDEDEDDADCSACGGSGAGYFSRPCHVCRGRGWVSQRDIEDGESRAAMEYERAHSCERLG